MRKEGWLDSVGGEAVVTTVNGTVKTKGSKITVTSYDEPNPPSTYSHYPQYGQIVRREGPDIGMGRNGKRK